MKLPLTIALVLLCITGSAQVQKTDTPVVFEVGQANNVGSLVAKLVYSVVQSDTIYTIYFNNGKYQHITDVQSLSFQNEDGALDSLYAILNSRIAAEKGTKQSLKLGNDDIVLTTIKVPGMRAVNITRVKDGAWFGLTQRQLNKLFNKKE